MTRWRGRRQRQAERGQHDDGADADEEPVEVGQVEAAERACGPAQMMNTPISEMWPTNPATVLSPTADTATARSTPDFWRKRTLSAIPPTLAGASLLANSDATWLTTSGPGAHVRRHRPGQAGGRTDVGDQRHQHHERRPPPVGLAAPA